MQIEFTVKERAHKCPETGTRFYVGKQGMVVCCESALLRNYNKPKLPFTLVITDKPTAGAIKFGKRSFGRTLRVPHEVQDVLLEKHMWFNDLYWWIEVSNK